MPISFTPYTNKRRLVAVANDEIWSETTVAGTLTQVTGAVVDTTDQLNIFELNQKAFIVNGSIKLIVDFINDKIDLGSGNELTTAPWPGDTLTQATSGAQMLVDYVDSTRRYIYGRRLTTAEFNTSNTVTSDNANDNDITMSPTSFTPDAVTAQSGTPHCYDWEVHPESEIEMPDKLYLGNNYRGRAVVSGSPEDPTQWWMFRQGNHQDLDYSADDAQSPVLGQNAYAGIMGDIVKAIIPITDDYMVYGCAGSMWLLSGDPMASGDLSPIYREDGIFCDRSWCLDNEGNLWFVGFNGLYVCPEGIGRPQNISSNPLPKFLNDIGANPETHTIVLGYDNNRHGIKIAITTIATGANVGYWYDLTTKGFFPESYAAVNAIFCMYSYKANDPDYSGLLCGTASGYVKVEDDTEKNDNTGETTAAIDSYVLCGPQHISDVPDRKGNISNIKVHLSESSDGVVLYGYKSASADKLVDNATAGTGAHFKKTISNPGSGYGGNIKQALIEQYYGLFLQNDTASESWELERITMNQALSGRQK